MDEQHHIRAYIITLLHVYIYTHIPMIYRRDVISTQVPWGMSLLGPFIISVRWEGLKATMLNYVAC